MNIQLTLYIACYDSNKVWLGSFPIHQPIPVRIAKQIRLVEQEINLCAFDDEGNSLSAIDVGFPIDYPIPTI